MSVRRAGAGRRTSALAKCGPTECELQPVLRGHRPRVRAVTGRSGRVRIMRCMSSFPSKKQIERELSILNTPTYMEAWESFVEYVRQLQDSRTATDLRMLQRELVFDVNGRQKALAAVVAEHAGEAKAKIEFLKAVEPRPKAELAGAQAILRGAKHAEAVADALQHATRVLADGMVWRALDYDRSMISILGKEPPVAHHADDKGFIAELAALELVEEQPGVLAFHNDTTNWLREGTLRLRLRSGDRLHEKRAAQHSEQIAGRRRSLTSAESSLARAVSQAQQKDARATKQRRGRRRAPVCIISRGASRQEIPANGCFFVATRAQNGT